MRLQIELDKLDFECREMCVVKSGGKGQGVITMNKV